MLLSISNSSVKKLKIYPFSADASNNTWLYPHQVFSKFVTFPSPITMLTQLEVKHSRCLQSIVINVIKKSILFDNFW